MTALRRSRKKCQTLRKQERRFLESVISNCKGMMRLNKAFYFILFFLIFWNFKKNRWCSSFCALVLFSHFILSDTKNFTKISWFLLFWSHKKMIIALAIVPQVIMCLSLSWIAKSIARRVRWDWQSAENSANLLWRHAFTSTVIPTGHSHGCFFSETWIFNVH